jgi:hypothetical protein
MTKLKLVGIAVCAICAFMAVSAGAAHAVPNFTYTNTAGKAVIPAAAETIGIEVVNGSTTPSELEVPGLLNLTGTGVAITGGVITGEKTATIKSLQLTGYTVSTAPSNCQIKGTTNPDPVGTISTGPISVELVTIGSTAYATFKPDSGTVFVNINISAKTGKSCPLSGTYPVTGSILATVPASGVHATTQSLGFTTADEKANEPTDGLRFGTSSKYVISTVGLKLSNDRPWGVDW